MIDLYQTGDVLRYPYLWLWQHRRGETEGRKDRPCCLALTTTTRGGQTRLYLLPITSTRPDEDEIFVQVPQIEARRAGLDADRTQWVILTEWNADILEASHYLDRQQKAQGSFSRTFLHGLLARLRQSLEQGGLATVRRDD